MICCIHVLMCFVVVICGCAVWLLFANSSSLLQSATVICCFHVFIYVVVVICGCYHGYYLLLAVTACCNLLL